MALSTSATSIASPALMRTTSENRLFALPAELREIIFTFAVVQEAHVCVRVTSHYCHQQKIYSFSLPALALVCRQTYVEVLSVYYRVNTFEFKLFRLVTHRQAARIFREWLQRNYQRDANMANLRRVCLHFAWDADRRNWRHVIAVKLGKDGSTRIEDLYVQTLCTCKLLVAVKEIEGKLPKGTP
jgi:hypothetical protein